MLTGAAGDHDVCLAVSHVTSDGTHPSVVAAIEDAYKTASARASALAPERSAEFVNQVASGMT